MTDSFIERQFPVSKISKESYKERRAGNTQTLTKFGKWWGRKPLILIRAAILGCLLPSTDNPEKDMDIFLKILSMDDDGLLQRKNKRIPIQKLYDLIKANHRLSQRYGNYFYFEEGKAKLEKTAPREEIEKRAFLSMGYDTRLAYCSRPEHVDNLCEQAWREINHHLGTSANSIQSLINQLSIQRYKHPVLIGDCFCGGGSIPFETARIGCDAYGSDLNPIAGLLTWAGINLSTSDKNKKEYLENIQRKVFKTAVDIFSEYEVEDSINNTKDTAYLYCEEAKCPECNTVIPLSPTWVIGKGTRTIAIWSKVGNHYDVEVKMNASSSEMKAAEKGTMTSKGLLCPCCGKTTPISVLRHDTINEDGVTCYGLRQLGLKEFQAAPNDVFHSRLYAIKYELQNGKRLYRTPNSTDLQYEKKIERIISTNIDRWQEQGLIPVMPIDSGFNTDQLVRERGWRYWYQLYTPRQLLEFVTIQEAINKVCRTKEEVSLCILNLNKALNFNSKLCRWRNSGDAEHNTDTFYNQALNTVFNYGVRPMYDLKDTFFTEIPLVTDNFNSATVQLKDARDVNVDCDIWITDPPYADAVNYHELSEFFLAWDKKLLIKAFPDWYTDSKRILAVRGDEHFSQTMIDIYNNLACHTINDGMQIVMFTHSDPSVWAQLALIMWKAGLKVTAAWNIATETDASGLKDGNYVKGTVLLVLRKQLSEEEAFLDELIADIKSEVKKQIESMQKLDDKEDPNFSDPDYVLAAYAASLKVLTGYKAIGEIDLDYELNLAIHDPSKSEVVRLIERAKRIAYDFIIPLGFDHFLWRELSPAERFYIKGLESEKHGNYQVSTYQEYARGFGLTSYSQLMANERANTARLKTPQEFAMRSIKDVPDFEQSILRLVLAAIYIATKEDEKPEKGFWYIKNNLVDYWNKRDMLRQLLLFLKDTEDIDTMPYWHEDAIMASHIFSMISNDHI